MHKTLIFGLWYSWNMWLTFWVWNWSWNHNLGTICRSIDYGASVLGLRSLIIGFSSWNPNNGCLAFMNHIGLAIDLVIDHGTLVHWSVVLDHYAMHHQSSSLLLFLGVIHQVDYWIYMPTCLMIHLIQGLVQAFIQVILHYIFPFKSIGPRSMMHSKSMIHDL